jgi:hypothetical protein
MWIFLFFRDAHARFATHFSPLFATQEHVTRYALSLRLFCSGPSFASFLNIATIAFEKVTGFVPLA